MMCGQYNSERNKVTSCSSWAKFQMPCQTHIRVPKSSRSQSWDLNGPRNRKRAFPTIPHSNLMLSPLFLSHSSLTPGWFLREGTTSIQRSMWWPKSQQMWRRRSSQACCRGPWPFLVPSPSCPQLPGFLRQHRDVLGHWTTKRRWMGDGPWVWVLRFVSKIHQCLQEANKDG